MDILLRSVRLAVLSDFTPTQPSQINNAAPSGMCDYPKHSTPACTNGNPCGFVCADGFTPFPADKPKECKCKGDHVEVCNDKCVPKGACPTHRMQDDRRRWLSSSSCPERGHGWLTCGVYGGGPRAWECVNSERDLESCESLSLFFFLVSLVLSGQVPAWIWSRRGTPQVLLCVV